MELTKRMGKILGIDLGTNSIGWAVTEKDHGKFSLLDKGVRIFQEGVKKEKGIENSKAAERTEYRSARRIKYRRKLRKIETLKVLSEYGFCPKLTKEELDNWKYKKIYPKNEAFRNWWLTDEGLRKHPYYFRYLAVTEKLNLNEADDKHILGRAFYHMAQRRGFLSNRLDSTPENETGKVKSSIKELQDKKGDRTLGQYFYEDCYLKGLKIRDQYTHREDDYLDEFNRICAFQNIPKEIQDKLYKAIFFQRPLKSQKGLIGKCVFEPNKPRCSTSRPEFEEYRMLCFINNIKIKTPDDEKLRPLNEGERTKIIPRFFLSRDHFDFEDLAKQIAPKKQYKYYRDRDIHQEDYLFNYSMKTTVSGCPVSSRFKDLFGKAFMDDAFNYAKDEKAKTPKEITDAWHALYTFDSDKKLKEFVKKHFGFNEEQITIFTERIKLKQDFASLSLKAINKILPYLRQGLIYSHAVFLANIGEVIPKNRWENDEDRKTITEAIKDIIDNQNIDKTVVNTVNSFVTNARRENNVWSEEAKEFFFSDIEKKIRSAFGQNKFSSFSESKQHKILSQANDLLEQNMPKNFGRGEHIKVQRIDESVIDYLISYGQRNDKYEYINPDKLYHPSAVETYKPAKRGKDGKLYLGSPMTSSVRNPMAMRALHQLRVVVNELIRENIIDSDTKIHIEMSRGLLNANERAGLHNWRESRKKARKEYVDKIKEHFTDDYEPSKDEILKYQLWEEQNHICLYTGQTISLDDFLGSNPKYDIEHTIPRSLSYDNSQANKTLCESTFNRREKRNKIPYALSIHTEILARIEHWQKKINELDKEIHKAVRQAKGAGDKAQKDKAIQKRHQLSNELTYWKNKYKFFTMKDVPDGFKNSQMVDIGIITKYSRLYLKTVFNKVYTVKGSIVADFRKMWGLQDIYQKKKRINHVHHCIDAITIACIDKNSYEALAKFYHDWEEYYQARIDTKPKIEKPWASFTQDILNIENEILVSHYTPDNLPKQSKKILRKRGKKQYGKDGKPIYQQGDTVRGSLHKDTFYGAIEREVPNKNTGELEKQIKYVVRKPIDGLENSSIKNIVDDQVREIVTRARKEEKLLQKKIDALVKSRKKADEQEEIAIDKEIASLKEQITLLYSMPNKNGAPIPIKKVRVYQPTVTNPLHIKKQRDKSRKSRKEYKEHYHVSNDGNYLMAIYEGENKKGQIIRDFEIVNNLDAGKYFKLSVKKDLKGMGVDRLEGLFPESKEVKGDVLKFKMVIKPGKLVLLYKESESEIWDSDNIYRRLYIVRGVDLDGIKLYYHNEARPTTDVIAYMNECINRNYEKDNIIDSKTGKIKKSKLTTPKGGDVVDKEKEFPYVKFKASNFNALIEGIDFKISPLGKIIRL